MTTWTDEAEPATGYVADVAPATIYESAVVPAERVQDGSFEALISPWGLFGPGPAIIQSAEVYSGNKALKIGTQFAFGGVKKDGYAEELLLPLQVDQEYLGSLWANSIEARDTGTDYNRLEVHIDAGDGTFVLNRAWRKSEIGMGWVRLELLPFIAVGETGAIRILSAGTDPAPQSTFGTFYWYVDLVSIGTPGGTSYTPLSIPDVTWTEPPCS